MRQFRELRDGSELGNCLPHMFRLTRDICSLPVGLQFEKFIIPDALRIVDALVKTLSY